jgi:hypothetical protein
VRIGMRWGTSRVRSGLDVNKYVFSLASTLAVAACAPAVQVSPASTMRTVKSGEFPPIKQRASATVGEVIYSQYRYSSTDSFVTAALLNRPLPPFATVQVAENTELQRAVVGGREVFCTATPAYFVARDRRSVCFYSKNAGVGAFDTIWVVGFPEMTGTFDIPPLPYKQAEVFASDGFKYELLYQGVDNRTLRISYREYSGNMARPAFQQDLTYTLAAEPPTLATFRTVHLEVYSANNNSIDYTVLSSFTR